VFIIFIFSFLSCSNFIHRVTMFRTSIISIAIKILDVICFINLNLIFDIFPRVKRFALDKFNNYIRRTNSRYSSLTFVGILQFILHYHKEVIFDVNLVLDSFMNYDVVFHYNNNLLAGWLTLFVLEDFSFTSCMWLYSIHDTHYHVTT
jgi:hypothetical protein